MKNIGPRSNNKFSTFTKKVDSKIGKGFCIAVRSKTFTPVLGGRVLGEIAKEAVKTAKFQGLNGPMRTDRKYNYQQKCDIYIALFEQMVTPVVDDIDALIRFQCGTLFKMVDDGMFVNLNYAQFVRQLRAQYLLFPGIEEEDLDMFLEDMRVQKEMKALWLA